MGTNTYPVTLSLYVATLTAHIHDFLRNCNEVFLVNSGVGFEAILHRKPIIRFGDAEYNSVSNSFKDYINNKKQFTENDYKKFFLNFIKTTYDSTNVESFTGRI